ncbi:MAG: hypothetical protein AAF674_13910 [Pseudomonadota bacterium]
MIPTFKSRFGLWCMRLAILVPGVLALGLPVFEFGGCSLGFTDFGGCRRIPDAVGEIALVLGLVGVYLTVYLSPVMVVGGAIAEWLARRD